ncbi:MAG: hypothetical protein WCJ26_12910 [bacterium]
MNLLFVNHNTGILSEIDDFQFSCSDTCFYSQNTADTIGILEKHPIGLVVMIINHMRDVAILKYLNDYRKDLEVLLVACEEYDEIITWFCGTNYKIHRLPDAYRHPLVNMDQMIAEHVGRFAGGISEHTRSAGVKN